MARRGAGRGGWGHGLPDLLSGARGAWLRSIFSEADGTGSSTRVYVGLVVSFSLGFVTALLLKVHGPITVSEFCSAVGVLGEFAGGICGALYGINRLGNWADNKAVHGPQN